MGCNFFILQPFWPAYKCRHMRFFTLDKRLLNTMSNVMVLSETPRSLCEARSESSPLAFISVWSSDMGVRVSSGQLGAAVVGQAPAPGAPSYLGLQPSPVGTHTPLPHGQISPAYGYGHLPGHNYSQVSQHPLSPVRVHRH